MPPTTTPDRAARSAGGATVGSPSGGPATGSTAPGEGLAASQGCTGGPADSGTGRIAWSQLRNPILSYPTVGIRDPSIRLVRGQWHLFFTSVVGTGVFSKGVFHGPTG